MAGFASVSLASVALRSVGLASAGFASTGFASTGLFTACSCLVALSSPFGVASALAGWVVLSCSMVVPWAMRAASAALAWAKAARSSRVLLSTWLRACWRSLCVGVLGALGAAKVVSGSCAGFGSLPSETMRWRSSRNCCCNLAARALSSLKDRPRTGSALVLCSGGRTPSGPCPTLDCCWVLVPLSSMLCRRVLLGSKPWARSRAALTVRSKLAASSGESLIKLPLLALLAALVMSS